MSHSNRPEDDNYKEKWDCLKQLQKKIRLVLLDALCKVEEEGEYLYDDPYWMNEFQEKIEQSSLALKECQHENYKKAVKIMKAI